MLSWPAAVSIAVHRLIASLLTRSRQAPRIDESKAEHIFRVADGHFPIDTIVNRRVLLRVAGDQANRLGADRFGVVWAARTMPDGSQVWVQIWDGRIVNGGVNSTPRTFNLMTGLSAEAAQGTEP
jgi:hypothetical protein